MKRQVEICPHCRGEVGGRTDGFCPHCGDYINETMWKEQENDPKPGNPAATGGPPPEAEVCCPFCGEQTRPLPLCENCAADLSERPGRDEGRCGVGLELIVGGESFDCRDGDVLGREGTIAVHRFETIHTVSRQHAMLTVRDGAWFVTIPAPVPNRSLLDGREMPRGVPQPISGEHRLRLSSQCEVRLRLRRGEGGVAG